MTPRSIFETSRETNQRSADTKAVEPRRRSAWKPVTDDADGTIAGSRFGGWPWLAPGENCPRCGACGKPMPIFIQLDLADTGRVIGQPLGFGLLQLFYCTDEGAQKPRSRVRPRDRSDSCRHHRMPPTRSHKRRLQHYSGLFSSLPHLCAMSDRHRTGRQCQIMLGQAGEVIETIL